MNRHRATTFGWVRWTALALFTGLLVALCIASAPGSQAASESGLPLIDVCPKDAPFAGTPESDLAGLLGERPVQITTDNSPEHIWSTGGFTGLRSHVYDLGCAMDPTSWARIVGASSDSKIVNAITSLGNSIVSLTDSVDRRSWQPGQIISFLSDFVSRVTGVIEVNIITPFLVLGVLVATSLLMWKSFDGDVSGTAMNVGWIMVVLTVSTVLLVFPLMAAQSGQAAGGSVVAMLNGGATPSDAATNQIVKNVEYQGWLRRNFGGDETEVGKTYGPDLLASTRVSWAELDSVRALPPKDQGKAMQAITERKAKEFKDIALKVKEADPTAYQYLTGSRSSSWEAVAEFLFVLASCTFRLLTALLMITATVTIVVLTIFWLVATPILVLPKVFRFSGQELGMTLINGMIRSVVIVLGAAVASWVFGIYLQAAIAPGLSLWFSLLMLIIGTGIAWAVLGPIAKFKEIVSLGKADGHSIVAKYLGSAALAYIGGRIGGKAAGKEIADQEEEAPQERLSEDVQEPKVVQATIYNPEPAFVPERPTHVDGEALQGTVIPALPGGAPVYERGETPPPPPDESASPYVPYERSDDNEGANL